MKNKLFAVSIVIVSIFLAAFWVREQSYRAHLKRIDTEVAGMQARVRLLRLKTEALKAEMELLNLSTYIELLRARKSGIRPGREAKPKRRAL
ncbi:MAG: hypothetical protein GY940_07390 [bacterium]|nr:hypothetical protein [bacterium]